MIFSGARSIRLVFVVVLLTTIAGAVFADEPLVHRVRVSGGVKSGTFAAEIDGQKFASPAAVEVYLAGLPAGSVVKGPREYFHSFDLSDDDMWRLFTYPRKLREFCLSHQLVYH